MIIAVQFIIKFGLFTYLAVDTALSPALFLLLVLATVLIAAGGNVINDIYDVEIDRVNRPERVLVKGKVSEKAANTLYMVLTFTGVSLGFIVANSIGKPSFSAIFILIAGLLYVYASQLKGVLMIGTIVISILTAMVLLIIVLLDIFPAITTDQMGPQVTASKIILYYALFAFYLNVIREIVKDLQDVNGDKKGGMNTLPIAIGRKRTTTLVFVLGALGLVALLYYMYSYLYQYPVMNLYFLIGIVAPFLIFEIKAWSANTTKEYALLSKLLKFIMLTGIVSLLMYQFIV